MKPFSFRSGYTSPHGINSAKHQPEPNIFSQNTVRVNQRSPVGPYVDKHQQYQHCPTSKVIQMNSNYPRPVRPGYGNFDKNMNGIPSTAPYGGPHSSYALNQN